MLESDTCPLPLRVECAALLPCPASKPPWDLLVNCTRCRG